eukprot:1160168-Pelagomonas_calceolata.AAC.6
MGQWNLPEGLLLVDTAAHCRRQDRQKSWPHGPAQAQERMVMCQGAKVPRSVLLVRDERGPSALLRNSPIPQQVGCCFGYKDIVRKPCRPQAVHAYLRPAGTRYRCIWNTRSQLSKHGAWASARTLTAVPRTVPGQHHYKSVQLLPVDGALLLTLALPVADAVALPVADDKRGLSPLENCTPYALYVGAPPRTPNFWVDWGLASRHKQQTGTASMLWSLVQLQPRLFQPSTTSNSGIAFIF